MMRKATTLIAAVLLSGCAYPAAHDEQGASPGMIYFPNAPTNAHVAIDGSDAGMATSYSGREVLAVTPGTHRIVVTTDGGVLLDKKYYVGAGARIAVQ